MDRFWAAELAKQACSWAVKILAIGDAVGAHESVSGTNRTSSDVRFSNRHFGVKHFQTIHQCGVDVARGLVLLFGIGTGAFPSWDSRTRRNNLLVGLAVEERRVPTYNRSHLILSPATVIFSPLRGGTVFSYWGLFSPAFFGVPPPASRSPPTRG